MVEVFEKVVRNHLVMFLDANDKFNLNQHGFRFGRSCLSQLLTHYDRIISILDGWTSTQSTFAKAFDEVDHSLVLKKLSMLGIRGKILQWIESFLTNRTQRVMVNAFSFLACTSDIRCSSRFSHRTTPVSNSIVRKGFWSPTTHNSHLHRKVPPG